MPIDIDAMTESDLIDLNHRGSCDSLTRTRPCSSSESASGSHSIPTGGHR